MDHAVAVLRGEAQPTVQDIISWIEEEAFRMGSLGFRHGYSNPSDIFSKFSMSSSVGDLDEWDRLENCATTAMRGIHDEIISMQRRMQIMKAHRGGIHDEIASREQHRMQVMNANAPLLARTEAWVNCELRKAGKSQADIDGYSKSQGRLREKVLDLYNLKHPHLDPPAGVPAVLYLGPKFERKVKVGLPIKASLAEVCELLDRVCASDDYLSLGWHEPSTLTGEGKKIWKYHLVDQEQMKLIRPDSTRLLSDADYNHLIRQFKRKRGVYSRYAVLTADVPPIKAPKDTTENKESDEDKAFWDPLNKDGTHYFDPIIDWGEVEVYDATGKIPEANLKKIVREVDELREYWRDQKEGRH